MVANTLAKDGLDKTGLKQMLFEHARLPASKLETFAGPRWIGADRIWTGQGVIDENRGEGIVVGVIDNGIWPEHPSFADDGSYIAPDIMPLDNSRPNCEFGNTAHNPNDAPFTCNNKLLGARQMMDTYRALIGAEPDEFNSAQDDDGHGTHTASTAAGNAGVAATVLVGVHSLFDFSLQMPAIAMTYASLMGVACAQAYPTRR